MGSPAGHAPGPQARVALGFAEACGGGAGDGEGVWTRLAALVAVDNFIFVGHDQAPLSWPVLVAKMAASRAASDFASAVERVEEAGNLVFLQLRECRRRDATEIVTMTVFEFEPSGLVRRIDTFG